MILSRPFSWNSEENKQYTMLKIYHNPRCKKSRAGLEYLRSRTNDFEVIDYIKNGLTRDDLKEILLKTNRKPADLVRKQEEVYKKELKGRSFTDKEWIDILCENPKLLQRPMVLAKHKAVLGDPPENINEVL
jgi:arsenate reductase (glutaredoxin)